MLAFATNHIILEILDDLKKNTLELLNQGCLVGEEMLCFPNDEWKPNANYDWRIVLLKDLCMLCTVLYHFEHVYIVVMVI